MSIVCQKGVAGGNKWRRVRGRPREGWIDGVKVALGNSGTTVEAARQCAALNGEPKRVESPGTYVTE